MNILIISKYGDGMGLAHRLADEHHADEGILDEIALTSDIQCRTDIGKGVMEEMGELRGEGWIE